ncbi:MAG: hypothetical protein ACHP7A_03515 [Caulobacterales bacterium]|jgi:hypothetical protein
MDQLIVQTRLGPLHVVGRLYAGRPRATLLAVGGAFPPPGFLHDLVDKHPHDNVIVGGLPGMGTPSFEQNLAADFATAFDELIATLAPGQPVVAYGVSTGSLVTLGLKAPNVVRHIAQEPFLNTADLWPFISHSQGLLQKYPDNALMAAFLDGLFGIGRDGVRNIDYEHLAKELRTPTELIVADLPLLPRRQLDTWPSLTSAHDRQVFLANPLVRLHEAPRGTGHHLVALSSGETFVHQVRVEALRAAASTEAPSG